MADKWVEKHAINQLQAVLTGSIILAENLKISHFLAGAKFRQHVVMGNAGQIRYLLITICT